MNDKVEKLLKHLPCDALIIEDPTDLYYMLGLSLSAGTLLIEPNGGHLIVDGRYFEHCSKLSPFPVLLAKEDTLPNLINNLGAVKELGFASNTTSYSRYEKLKEVLQKVPRVVTLIPIEQPLRNLRKIKTPVEITLLKQAAELGSLGFDYVCSLLKEGVSESEMAFELELFWKKKGAKGFAFDPIIAFGANSSMPHYRAGDDVLKKNQVVLIDIGVTYQHYHSDMTRTLFYGTPDPLLLKIYPIVLQAQKAALALCRPGTKVGAVDSAARSLIVEEGFGDQFPHSLGHGIGLEVHEFPLLRDKPPHNDVILEAGMVITIEPGIYIPGVGGIRIEDSIQIVDNGYENLTNRSKDLLCLVSDKKY